MKLLFHPFITKSLKMHSSFPSLCLGIDTAEELMTSVANTKTRLLSLRQLQCRKVVKKYLKVCLT